MSKPAQYLTMIMLLLASACGSTLVLLAQPYEPTISLDPSWLPASVQGLYAHDPCDILLPTWPGEPNKGIDLPYGVWTRPSAVAWDDGTIKSLECIYAQPDGTPLASVEYDADEHLWSTTIIVEPGFHWYAYRATDNEGTWNDYRICVRGINRGPVLQ